MNFTIEFFRTRPSDGAHATLDRISIVANNLDAATVKAKSLFETLDMPQKPDGLRILDEAKREVRDAVPLRSSIDTARCRPAGQFLCRP
jgi:hypothetical protein